MAKYDASLNNILNTLEASLNASAGASQVLTSIRLEDKEYKFPNITILPEADSVEDIAIGGARRHTISVDIHCSLKSYKGNEQGTDSLISFLGNVVQVIDDKRRDRLNGYCEDIYLNAVDYHYFPVDNYIIYEAVVKIIIEYIEE